MTYTYECETCGTFSIDKGINDKPLKECPTCKKPIKRIFAPIGTVVKCSGFYGKGR